jgi:hypothetical protein
MYVTPASFPSIQERDYTLAVDQAQVEPLKIWYIVSGWWCTYTSEKYDFVSWDDDIPNT